MSPASFAISAISGVLGGSIALAMLRGLLPTAPPAGHPRDIEALRAEFSVWRRGSTAAWVAAICVSSVPVAFCLRATDRLVERTLPPATFLLMPRDLLFWSLPGILLVASVAGGISESILRRVLRDRYANFVTYRNAVARFDTRRAERIIYPAAAVLATIGIILGLDWYTYFTDFEIVVNDFWSLGQEQHHPYADVVSIETAPEIRAPNGNHVRRREYLIHFEDGSSWCTNMDPSEAPTRTKAQIADLVSSKSGKPITEVPFLRP